MRTNISIPSFWKYKWFIQCKYEVVLKIFSRKMEDFIFKTRNKERFYKVERCCRCDLRCISNMKVRGHLPITYVKGILLTTLLILPLDLY